MRRKVMISPIVVHVVQAAAEHQPMFVDLLVVNALPVSLHLYEYNHLSQPWGSTWPRPLLDPNWRRSWREVLELPAGIASPTMPAFDQGLWAAIWRGEDGEDHAIEIQLDFLLGIRHDIRVAPELLHGNSQEYMLLCSVCSVLA